MKLGFFTMPIHPVGRDYSQTLREDRELAILADQLGFVDGFFGEHFTDAAENITSSLIFIAWLLEATERIRLGTGTLNLPNHHPARLAAEVAMVDNMAKGRFLMGISPGGLPSDAEAMGNLDKDRNAMFLECINQVLEIWTSEPPYNIKGEYWNVDIDRTQIPDIGQGRILRSYQKPHPPIVVTAVAPFSKGVAAAAARGWDPISANFLQRKWVKTHWPQYEEGCLTGNRVADPANWRVAKSIFVADTEEKARSYALAEDGSYYYYYRSLFTKLLKAGRANLFKTDQNQADEDLDLDTIVRQLIIFGTPQSVTDQLLGFRDEVGPFGTLLYAGHDWKDKKLAVRSMELMATDVIPAINAAVAE